MKLHLASGEVLTFSAFDRWANWHDVPGIYMFCRLTPNGWAAVYVGQTNSLKTRLCDHERWHDAAGLGATQVMAMVVARQEDRDRLEQLLIQHWNPTLNTQLRAPQLSGLGLRSVGMINSPPVSARDMLANVLAKQKR